MATSTKKTPTSKGNSKKSGKSTGSGNSKNQKKKGKKFSKVLSGIVSVIVVVLFAGWFLLGKPIVEIGTETGLTFVLTEDPILFHLPEYIAGEYPPKASEIAADTSSQKPTAESESGSKKTSSAVSGGAPSQSTSPVTKTNSGTTGSDPKADQGHPENNPLFFGNPTDAYNDTSKSENYLMIKPQYTLSYNTSTLNPNWVAWHLDTSNIGDADRCDDFRPDPELPADWYAVKKADYQYNKYGFDRGHVCPSADRTTTKDDNSMTFLMTNMVPQSPDNNRVIWMHFENYERELAKAGNELYIIAGPYGTGGTTSKGTFDEIPISLKNGQKYSMNVPASTWKVVLVLPVGDNDLSRVTADSTVIAINVPNEMGMGKTGDWEQFITTIDEIESLTGYDFFELLPDAVENVLEAKKYQRVN